MTDAILIPQAPSVATITDNVIQVVSIGVQGAPGSGNGVWGSIAGNIENQTDLQAEFSNYLTISAAATEYDPIGSAATAQANAEAFSSNASNLTSGTVAAARVAILNQNTTGTAANITATSNSTLTSLPSLSVNYSQLTGTVPTWNQNTTGQAGTVATINGLIASGSNVTITGSGTSGSPYTISSSGGGGGSPAGPTNAVQTNGGSGSFAGDAGLTYASGLETITANSLANTVPLNKGLIIQNTTLSTMGTQQQNSPPIQINYHGWSSANVADKAISFLIYGTSTTPSFGIPFGTIVVQQEIGTTGYSNVLTIGGAYYLTVAGPTDLLSQLLIQGPFTANSIGSFNGAITAYSTATFTGATYLNNLTQFASDFFSNDDLFYYTHSTGQLNLGNGVADGVLSVTTQATSSIPNPTSYTTTLIPVLAPTPSFSASQNNAGTFYTANGSTYDVFCYAIGTNGLYNLLASNSFIDDNSGNPFSIDFAFGDPSTVNESLSQFLIGLSINYAPTNYRYTGNAALSFNDNDGNYPYSTNPAVGDIYNGYLADGNTLNNTYTLALYEYIISQNVYSPTPLTSTTTDPADNTYYVIQHSCGVTNDFKIVRTGDLTGGYLGTSAFAIFYDDTTLPWGADSTLIPTFYELPAGAFHALEYVITTDPTSPSLSEGGADSSYPYPTTIEYRIFSYKIINGVKISSTTYLYAGSITVGNSGGGVNINWTADPNASGYFVVKSVNGAGFILYGDAGSSTSASDDAGGGGTGISSACLDPFSLTVPDVADTAGYVGYIDNTGTYAFFTQGTAKFGNIVIGRPISVASGGTGRTDGLIGDGSGGVYYNMNSGVFSSDTAGTNKYFDVVNKIIYGSSGTLADFQSGYLYDSSASLSVDFNYRFLYASGGVPVLRWQGGAVFYQFSNSTPACTYGVNSTSTANMFQVENLTNATFPYIVDVNGKVGARAGTNIATFSLAKMGGTIADHYADVGSTSTTETDLYSDTITAGTLGTNGDKLIAEYGLVLANSTSTKDVRVYFGGTKIFDSGALTISAASSMVVDATIMRDSSTTIRYSIKAAISGASLGDVVAVGKLTGLSFAGSNVLKITGQAGGAGVATNDVQAQSGTVIWQPAF